MPIRYIRANDGNIHVNIIDSPLHLHTIVLLPHFFSRITGVSLNVSLGYTEINALQAAKLGFIIPVTKEAVSA
ncbi:hypothetical protein GCM10008018_60510 [Paenibacillus marchantiophytorum]|uniref:Uncharacterized protein n=1 Tax=Paenibacillus marchantiophytorum TaxID=1619310 RepID=A0ABQ1FD80_9BACL|nr:hypothetical protein [Paenibacillus marchantiophytorum]GGA06541.1 hypothetical protein GCM10008018_60510 [Paenibacillus marchantiophytorum]